MPALDRARPIVGVGMKMHLGYAESVAYLERVADAAPRLRGAAVFILPSFPLLARAADLLAHTGIVLGAQDGHWEQSGPHTGSVSPAMLAELGCALMEVGHAERRRDFGEDDAMCARKAAAAAQAGVTPLVCVGEHDADADAAAVVAAQLAPVLEACPSPAIAYEPVWAIGAEAPARPDRVARALGAIRERVPAAVPVLYGGSVAPDGVPAILEAGADGVFASRSALEPGGLEALVEAAT